MVTMARILRSLWVRLWPLWKVGMQKEGHRRFKPLWTRRTNGLMFRLVSDEREGLSLLSGDLEKPFMMYVEDVFSIAGRGTVVTGKVERGTIAKGADVELVGLGQNMRTILTGIGEL